MERHDASEDTILGGPSPRGQEKSWRVLDRQNGGSSSPKSGGRKKYAGARESLRRGAEAWKRAPLKSSLSATPRLSRLCVGFCRWFMSSALVYVV
jgi:hypothetical protein